MNLQDYLIKHTRKPSKQFRNFSKEKTESLFLEFKSLWYNHQNSKWSKIKDCIAYIKRENIDPEIFIQFSTYLINRYYKLNTIPNDRGKETALSFLKELQGSPKLTTARGEKIELKEDINKLEFLNEMKFLKKFLNLTHDKWIDHIHSHYGLNYTKSTLRKYYYDK